ADGRGARGSHPGTCVPASAGRPRVAVRRERPRRGHPGVSEIAKGSCRTRITATASPSNGGSWGGSDSSARRRRWAGFGEWEPCARVSVIGLLGTVLGGWPIFEEAWENIRERRMTMELSMTIALVAALVIGEFFTALMITAFVLVAEVLEGMTVGRGRRAIRDLLDFLPAAATVRRGADTARLPVSDITVG